MNTRIMFARGVACMMMFVVVGCMSHTGKDSGVGRVFLGVDLSNVPKWSGYVSGTEHTTTGCRPFQYRTKEVKLPSPFLGFESMVLCSAKCYLRRHSVRLVDCNWDSVGIASIYFRRSEDAENLSGKSGNLDKASAQTWLNTVANTMREMFGVEMKKERESEGLISMRGETESVWIYCSVSRAEAEVTSSLSSKAKISYFTNYDLQVCPKNTDCVVPSCRSQQKEVEAEIDS